VVKATSHIGEPNRSSLPAMIPVLKTLATVLDGHLGGRDYVACNRLTIADFQLASMACDWRRSEMPLDDYPHIVRSLDGLMPIPALPEPWPTKAVETREQALAR
jgi:glutathione S-transferase